jgi:threonine dehydratase
LIAGVGTYDPEIFDEVRLLLRLTHNLAEGAGAAATAAALPMRDRLAGSGSWAFCRGATLNCTNWLAS